MKEKFKVSEIRELLNEVYSEEISFSRFVEILNERKMPNNLTSLSDMSIVKTIKDWAVQGVNNCPNDADTSKFVREIIPYLESLELRISLVEQQSLS